MDYYMKHDDEAEEIARNSYETFARRYLTPAAVSRSVAHSDMRHTHHDR
jgi:spore maturation protein CgeB